MRQQKHLQKGNKIMLENSPLKDIEIVMPDFISYDSTILKQLVAATAAVLIILRIKAIFTHHDNGYSIWMPILGLISPKISSILGNIGYSPNRYMALLKNITHTQWHPSPTTVLAIGIILNCHCIFRSRKAKRMSKRTK